MKSPVRLLVTSFLSFLLLNSGTVMARSLLEGLELVDAEKSPGVEIILVPPESPPAKAGLKAGDRITAIGGKKVRNLDDYVKASPRLDSATGRTTVEYYRGGARYTAELSLQSSPILEQWGIPVIPWREAAEKKDPAYWLERARREMKGRDTVQKQDRSPLDYAKPILSLFTALNKDPGSLPTMVLIGRQYGLLASFYAERGETKKAAWCMRRVLTMYGKGFERAENLQDMAVLKNGLGEIQETIASLGGRDRG